MSDTDIADVKKVSKINIKTLKGNTIGLLLLLAIVSIGYSSVTIVLGTKGLLPLVMIVPQAVLAVIVLIWKFCK